MSEEQKQESGTGCLNCIFAQWKDKRQVGCKLGRIEKFAERNTELDIVKHEDGREFYLIKNRICLMLCTEDWLKRHPEVKDPEKDMRRLTALSCDIMILVDNDQTLEGLRKTLHSLLQQQHKPAKINVILHSDHIHPAKIRKILQSAEDEYFSFKWQLTHIQERGPKGEKPSIEWALDHVIQNCKSPFYAVFYAGYEVPADYLLLIDQALNDELEKFSVLLPVDDWNGAFIQTYLHKRLHGNAPEKLEDNEDGDEVIGVSIMDKAHFIAARNNYPYMVRRVEEICPTLPH
jgi:hypothetical protein